MAADMIPETVLPVDCHYEREKKAAAFLILEDGRAAFVDNNTNHAVPYLIEALEAQGLTSGQVEYAIITHVHLDHAGGTAALLQECPNATLLAHPKAARHMIDPSRLIAGAMAVYGEETFRRLYGTIEGVDEARVRTVADGEEVAWGSRRLRFFYTLGHATHHCCIHDSATNGVFAGDAFGLGMSPFLREEPPFVVCTSAPPDFDPPEARKSVQKILDTGADWAYLPHFGIHNDLETRAKQLLRSIDQFEAIVKEAVTAGLPNDALRAFCAQRVDEATRNHLRSCGVTDIEADMRWLGEDIEINAMGIAFLAKRRRRERQSG